MTAEELIRQLQALPPETPVLVEGYETGYDDIAALTSQSLVRYRNAQEWDGEYQSPHHFSGSDQAVFQAAVILGRRGQRSR